MSFVSLRATSKAFTAIRLNIILSDRNSELYFFPLVITNTIFNTLIFLVTKSYRTALHSCDHRTRHAHASSLLERRSFGELTQTVIQRAGESHPVDSRTPEPSRTWTNLRDAARTRTNTSEQACASRTLIRHHAAFVVRRGVAWPRSRETLYCLARRLLPLSFFSFVGRSWDLP